MRVIWQYWETRGRKPGFVDGLYEIARRNSGCTVTLVTPATLKDYLPDLPDDVLRIKEIAHKADMIRSMLVARHGGMWLDSDAVVLQDLNWLFDLLDDHEFVGFNNEGRLGEQRPWVRVNCFASRAGGAVISEWVSRQQAKFPRTTYGWEEIGTEILHPVCLSHRERVKILPFESICPIPWNKVEEFTSNAQNADEMVANSSIIMLSNYSLKSRAPSLRTKACCEIAQEDHLLGSIMRSALRGVAVDEPAPSTLTQRFRAALRRLGSGAS